MEKADCIVVGAGPAGAACAISLARKGFETVLLERARQPGEKNVASAVVFTPVLEQIVPEYLQEAPLERKIGDHAFVYLTGEGYGQLRMRFPEHYQQNLAFTVYRSQFDRWFAEKAVEAGAELLPDALVTDLVWDGNRVVGVKVGEEEIRANVVIGADGLHSVVGRKAGLVTDDISRYLLGVKEVLDLSPGVIEERFQLNEGEGACLECVGYPLNDICGATTLYTNRDSISLAVFGWVDLIREKSIDLNERLQMVKEQHLVRNLVGDAPVREYQAHMISDGGRVSLQNLFGNGVLLCGEAGGFVVFYVGISTGMLSGMMAAEAVDRAREKGDYSARGLGSYVSLLQESGLLDSLYDTRRFSNYLVKRGRENFPDFLQRSFDLMGEGLAGEFSFQPRAVPASREFFYNLEENIVPGFMRLPLRSMVKILDPAVRNLKRINARRKLG